MPMNSTTPPYVDPDPAWVYGYEVLRGSGVDGYHDGIIYKNLLASYAHLRHVGGVGWPARFIAQVRRCRRPGEHPGQGRIADKMTQQG